MVKKRAKSRTRMATARPSRGSAKKLRPRTKKRAAKQLKPVARKKTNSPDPLDDYIVAAAHALGLPLQSQWCPAVKTNLAVTLRQAALVTEFPLPDDAEPAPVFVA